MILIAVYLHATSYLKNLSIYADTEIALTAHALEELTIVALALTHQRCQEEDAPASIVVEYHLDDLFLGIFHHFFTAAIAISCTCTCVEQAQVVVNLGSCTYRGTRILVGSLLLNADNRAETRNLVDIGSFHAT